MVSCSQPMPLATQQQPDPAPGWPVGTESSGQSTVDGQILSGQHLASGSASSNAGPSPNRNQAQVHPGVSPTRGSGTAASLLPPPRGAAAAIGPSTAIAGSPPPQFLPTMRPMRPPFFIREIYKNGFLKRLPYNEKKSSALAKLMKSDRFWVVFSIHDDVHPFLELWHEPTEVATKPPHHIFPLVACQHISPSIIPADSEWSFVINFDTVAIRFSCNSREVMTDWVDVIRNKLGEMGILNPKGNLYSRAPLGSKPVVGRDPTSPLPQPPSTASSDVTPTSSLEAGTSSASTSSASSTATSAHQKSEGGSRSDSKRFESDAGEATPSKNMPTSCSTARDSSGGGSKDDIPYLPASSGNDTTAFASTASSASLSSRTKSVIETIAGENQTFTTSIYLNQDENASQSSGHTSVGKTGKQAKKKILTASHVKGSKKGALPTPVLLSKVTATTASTVAANSPTAGGGVTSSLMTSPSAAAGITASAQKSAIMTASSVNSSTTAASSSSSSSAVNIGNSSGGGAETTSGRSNTSSVYLNLCHSPTRHITVIPINNSTLDGKQPESGGRARGEDAKSDAEDGGGVNESGGPEPELEQAIGRISAGNAIDFTNHTYGAIFEWETGPPAPQPPAAADQGAAAKVPTGRSREGAGERRSRERSRTIDEPPPLPHRPVLRRLSERRSTLAGDLSGSHPSGPVGMPSQPQYQQAKQSHLSHHQQQDKKLRRKSRRSSSLGPLLDSSQIAGSDMGASTLSLESVESNPRQAVPKMDRGLGLSGAVPRRFPLVGQPQQQQHGVGPLRHHPPLHLSHTVPLGPPPPYTNVRTGALPPPPPSGPPQPLDHAGVVVDHMAGAAGGAAGGAGGPPPSGSLPPPYMATGPGQPPPPGATGFPPMVPLPGLTCQFSIPAGVAMSPLGPEERPGGQQRSIREKQVMRLRQEIAHPAGVRLILRKKDVSSSLALVDLFGCVWVVGWKQKEYPVLYNAFHMGDQIISVSGVIIRHTSEFTKLLKLKSSELHSEIIIRRVPFAQIYHLKGEIESQSLGILPHGNSAEIKEIIPGSLAAQAGITGRTRSLDGQSGVPQVITELNCRPISIFSKDGETWERLQKCDRELSVILHPADIVAKWRKLLKSFRGYKDFVLS